MKTTFRKITSLVLPMAAAVLMVACAKEEDTPPVSTVDYSKGIFVVNEGPFNSGSGTITWFSKDGSGRIVRLFEQSNNLLPVGNLAQSMTVINGDGFIVVNNANVIRKVSLKTFQQKGTLEGINLPRYIANTADGRAWVSSWDNKVVIFDPESMQISGEVSTGTGPEKMLVANETLWVLNQGGYSIDSTVTIIDINSKQVIQTLEVYPKPTGIQQDKNGKIWIMCSGNGWNGWPAPSDSKGHLVCIDPDTYTIVADFEFPASDQHPEKLEINAAGDELYYNYPGGVFKQSVLAGSLDLTALISRPGMFYGLDYDASADMIYTTDAGDFQQDGWVFRYQLSGSLVDSLQAGIGPTDICIP